MRTLQTSFAAALLLSTSAAFAGPADDFASDLKAFAAKNDLTVEFGSVAGDNGNFVMKDVDIKGDEFNATIGNSQVTGYEKTGTTSTADAYKSENIEARIPSVDAVVTFASFTTTGFSMPEDTNAASSYFTLYDTQAIENMTVSQDGVTLGGMQSSSVVNTPDGEGGYRSEATVEGMRFELGKLLSGPTKAIAAEMGYETLTGHIQGTTHYQPDEGILESDDSTVVIDNAMTFKTSYRIVGYTDQFTKQMAQWNETYTTPESQQTGEALAALQPMLSNLKLARMTLQLTDQSLTGKLLDLQAKQMGTTADQLAESAPLFIGMAMGQLQMPELSQMVATGVGQFLKDKGTLTIALEPAEPVSIGKIMQTLQSDATSIPAVLNLSITSTK